MFTDAEKRDFLVRLSQVFADPEKISLSVFDRALAWVATPSGKKVLSLYELDAYGVFKPDGSINQTVADKFGIEFDKQRIATRLDGYGSLKHLTMREKIIFESAISTVIIDLSSLSYMKLMSVQDGIDSLAGKNDERSKKRKLQLEAELELIRSHQPDKGLDKEVFADFWPPRDIKLKNPLSMELSGPAQQMIGGGYYRFKDTNVSISPGPHSSRATTPESAPEHYDPKRDIAVFLDNLRLNKVAHVFAMGRTFPYFPQDGFEDRKILEDRVLEEDFINYFIPDENGKVKLPDLPELMDLQVNSHPIKKVGRFITYEISINGSQPIQVHHFPIRDKQPLEFTSEELAYVQEIGKTTPPEQNIHTHCRGGKGRSAQVAYLLASLNPKYSQLTHQERLAQMRSEKTPQSIREFVETPIQEQYVEDTGYLFQDQIDFEAIDNGDIGPYVIYGTLLKQEIDQTIKLIGLPQDKNLMRGEYKALHELMERYQELSATPREQLPQWIEKVSRNPLLSEKTKASFEEIKNTTDYLVREFKENAATNKSWDDLQLYIRLQTNDDNYVELIAKIYDEKDNLLMEVASREKALQITSEDAQKEREKIEKSTFSFITHIQEAYLKNSENLSLPNKAQLRIDVSNTISEKLDAMMNAFSSDVPLTKEQFEKLEKEYHQYKPLIGLLEKSSDKKDQDQQSMITEFNKYSNLAEQIFFLGYDRFALEPSQIALKMEGLYQQLGEYRAANELDPTKWKDLNAQFTALKTILEFTKAPEDPHPQIQTRLEKLFQGKRENTYIPSIQLIIISEVKKVEPKKEQELSAFVEALGSAVLEKLPPEYLGEDQDGVHKQIFNQLLGDIGDLATSYRVVSGDGVIRLDEKPQKPSSPSPQEYEKARKEVVELISKATSGLELISKATSGLELTTDLKIRLENLQKDYNRLERNIQLRTPEFVELQKQFDELIAEYKKVKPNQDDEVLNSMISEFNLKLKGLVDFNAEYLKSKQITEEQHKLSIENALRIKELSDASQSVAHRETQEEIDHFESIVEPKKQRGKYPERPKLIVFDVDETLLDLEKNKLKRAEALIPILKYAQKNNIKVAIATNRTPGLDKDEGSTEKGTSVAQLKEMILKETGIDIPSMLTFLDTPTLRNEKSLTLSYFDEKINKLKQQKEELSKQLVQAPHQPEAIKQETREKIDKIQSEIDSLEKRAHRLASGKFNHLDSIRRHYHDLEKPQGYEEIQNKIFADFKSTEQRKALAIDESEPKKEAWTALLALAEKLRENIGSPKPSIETTLKAIILDSDKPERLTKGYGFEAQFNEQLKHIKDKEIFKEEKRKLQEQWNTENKVKLIHDNKDYFNIAQIDSFYESRLAAHKLSLERKETLREEDVVFLDDNENIIQQTRNQSNYRTVKVSPDKEDSFRYLVDFNYELGAYNGVIAYLNGDKERAPADYGVGKRNAFASYLPIIPNFKAHEFTHSPIVIDVKMSVILAKLPELSKKEDVQKRYKEQFLLAGLERYPEMSPEIKKDFVQSYYRDAHKSLEAINSKLRELVTTPPANKASFREELTKLKAQADKIIAMDEKFARSISPTFLAPEAQISRTMIVSSIFSGNFSDLTVDQNKVKLKEKHEELKSAQYTVSIKHKPDIYQFNIDPDLQELDLFDKEFVEKQYELTISQQMQSMRSSILAYAPFMEKDDEWSILSDQVMKDEISISPVQLLKVLQDDFKSLDFNDLSGKKFIEVREQLLAAQEVCKGLESVLPHQKVVDNLKGEPEQSYELQLSELSKQIASRINQIENSNQYNAMLFLDKAEEYIRNKNWNVGLQWTKHTITVDGKTKKIPATVAEQLEIIRQARQTGDFVAAKAAFLEKGNKKEISFNSSKSAQNYYSLFKKELKSVELEKDLEQEFSSQKIK
ncbi:hypothetical protein OQJ26_09385 [Legionella sp. PATHC038]|uniref:hypothetical protein n=1 Tax=Legionella sheltonii TaxID=2992041 RepID=UPI0022437A62|nr:hypothetical protein [Legionella sp. PATHC038]MCW8399001.1 hypothetical protein [Legionella sp. PATHC038]